MSDDLDGYLLPVNGVAASEIARMAAQLGYSSPQEVVQKALAFLKKSMRYIDWENTGDVVFVDPTCSTYPPPMQRYHLTDNIRKMENII